VGGWSHSYEFDVPENTTTDATFDVSVAGLVSLLDGASATLEVFNEETGQWEFVGDSAEGGVLDLLGLSEESVRVIAEDLQSGQYRLIFSSDTVLAVAPSVELDVTLNDTRAIGNGVVAEGNVLTNDTVAGEALEIQDGNGNFVVVAEGGTTIEGEYGTLTINPDGSYVYEPFDNPSAVGQQDVFTYRLGDDTATLTFSIQSVEDTTPPAALTVTLENDTGTADDRVTSDGTVVVGGLEEGATWEYSTDGGQTWTDGTGTSFELPEGTYTDVQVRQTDAAGNTGAPVSLGPVTVDATLPAAPAVALETDTGTAGDGITSDGTVTVGGLEEGATWEYSTDGGQTWTPGTGNSFDLAAGDYADGVVQVRQTDEAGNEGTPASLGPVTVDTTVAAPVASLESDTGTAGDGVTSDGTVTVGGLEEGATWEYSTDGGQSWTTGTGTSFELAAGDYADGVVQVRQTDAAGNTGETSLGPVTVIQLAATDNTATVDLTVTPATSEPQTQSATVGGVLALGALGETLNVSLLADNSVFTFSVDENTTQQVTLSGEGSALLSTELLGDNDYDLYVYRVANGETEPTLVHQVTDWLDFTPGLLGLVASTWEGPELTLPILEGGGTYYVVLANPTAVLDASLLSNITVEATSVVTDYRDVSGSVSGGVLADDTAPAGTVVSTVDGTAVTAANTVIEGDYGRLTINPDGTYSYEANSPFTGSDGAQDVFTYTIRTPDGSTDTATLTITLDLPAIAPGLALENDTGTAGDGLTNDGTVTVSGLEDGATWEYSTDGGQNWTTGTGTSFELAAGTYEDVQVRQTDAAGNTGEADSLGPVTVIQLEAANNTETVNLTVTPTTSEPALQTGTVGGLLNVGLLGDTVDVSLLSGNSALTFNVAENTTRQVTVDGNGFATLNLSLLGDVDFDLQVYRAEAGSNVASLVYEQADWLVGSGVLAATWNSAELALPEFQGGGTYYIVLGNSGGLLDLSLLGGLSVSTVSDVITDYRNVSGSVSGGVLADDTAPAGAVVSTVDGTAVTAADTVIEGDYGRLTINPDGTYSYEANSPFTGSDGAQDVFTYTIRTPDGSTDTATLTITLDHPGTQEPFAVAMTAETFSDGAATDGFSNDVVPLGDISSETDEGSEIAALGTPSGKEQADLAGVLDAGDEPGGDIALGDEGEAADTSSDVPQTIEDPLAYLPTGSGIDDDQWANPSVI
jgi:VCBS repeat-containing protein